MIPLQPIYKDGEGVLRFRKNEIVRFLLDAGQFDLHKLAMMSFPKEDWEQFAMLTGYSVCGFEELPYASEETWERVEEEVANRRNKIGDGIEAITKEVFNEVGKKSIKKIIKEFLKSKEGRLTISSIIQRELNEKTFRSDL